MRQTYNRSHANRGAKLEMLVDMTHNQLRNAGVADIRKIPTPVQITSANGNRVTGRLEKATWVDYSGVYKGRAIIFDAKETTIKNLPLANIAQHQYDLLCSWHKQGAHAFLLVAFWLKEKNEPEVYMLPFTYLEQAWQIKTAGGRKSIPLAFFQESCQRVTSGSGFVLNYLPALEVQ